MYQDFIREIRNDILIVKINLTRATLKEAESFKHFVMEDIAQGTKKIIVDLSECEYVDSTFLGVLVISLKNVVSNGGDLRLVGFQPAVYSLFELINLHRLFEYFKTIDDAVISFKEE